MPHNPMANRNDPTNWERRLKGEVVALTSTMEPDYGFYRVPTKDRTSWRAVAYWYGDDGKLCCTLDGRPLREEQATMLWSWASRNPITHELYRAVIDGAPWPDVNAEVHRISNEAPEDNSFTAIQERIDDLSREADRLIAKGAAKTQEDADQAANVAEKLSEYWHKADTAREIEKRPYLDKSNEIQAKWRPLLATAEIHKRLKQIVCAPWLASQKRAKEKAEAEALQAAQEAARKARDEQAEAERKAQEALQTGDTRAHVEASAAAGRAEEAQQEAIAAKQKAHVLATTTITAGTTGRRGVHLRGEKVYEISDRDALFAYLKNNPKAIGEIDELMLKHGKAIAKTGLAVPGIKISDGEMAA